MVSGLLMLIVAACPAQSQPEWQTADARTKREMLRACGSVPARPTRALPDFVEPWLPPPPREQVFGLSVTGVVGKGFFARPPDVLLPNDLVGGVALEVWAIVSLSRRVELHPMIGGFWVTRWAGPITGVGVAAGLRLRFNWDRRLSSGLGVSVGPGSFFVNAEVGDTYDSHAVFTHGTVTLIALRVSTALRLALDAGFSGFTHWYPKAQFRQETEGALLTRLSAEFLF